MEEMFSGGCFPAELTPFPEPQLQPPQQPPSQPPMVSSSGPQKLRPIRSNARICHSSDHPTTEEDDELFKLKSQMDAHFASHISQLAFCSFSSSSDCSDDSLEEEQDPSSNDVKPRKKRRREMESYLQDLMAKVLDKQEQMHQQLMNVLQTRERERILREEAWRREEMDRLQKDQHLRSQQAARSLALISYLRNALGDADFGVPDIQLPHPLSLPGVFTEDPRSLQLEKLDPDNTAKWPTSEVQALITLRAALDHMFRTPGAKTPAWEHVSAGMASMGFIRSWKKCKEKWENVNKYYRRLTGNGTKQSSDCPYFRELDTLYQNQLISTAPKPNSPTHPTLSS